MYVNIKDTPFQYLEHFEGRFLMFLDFRTFYNEIVTRKCCYVR
jgi:hypothetical protein